MKLKTHIGNERSTWLIRNCQIIFFFLHKNLLLFICLALHPVSVIYDVQKRASFIITIALLWTQSIRCFSGVFGGHRLIFDTSSPQNEIKLMQWNEWPVILREMKFIAPSENPTNNNEVRHQQRRSICIVKQDFYAPSPTCTGHCRVRRRFEVASGRGRLLLRLTARASFCPFALCSLSSLGTRKLGFACSPGDPTISRC